MGEQQTGRASGCLAMMPVVPRIGLQAMPTESLMPEPASGIAWRTPSEHKVLDGGGAAKPPIGAPPLRRKAEADLTPRKSQECWNALRRAALMDRPGSFGNFLHGPLSRKVKP